MTDNIEYLEFLQTAVVNYNDQKNKTNTINLSRGQIFILFRKFEEMLMSIDEHMHVVNISGFYPGEIFCAFYISCKAFHFVSPENFYLDMNQDIIKFIKEFFNNNNVEIKYDKHTKVFLLTNVLITETIV